MFYFVVRNYSLFQLILFFVLQFLPFSLLHTISLKLLMKEKAPASFYASAVLSSLAFSAVYALLVYHYCPDIIYIHGFLIVIIQFLAFLISYFIFWKNNLFSVLHILVASLFSMLAIDCFSMLYPFIAQFDKNPFFSNSILCWYLTAFLLLLPLVKRGLALMERKLTASLAVSGIIFFLHAGYCILFRKISVSRYPNGLTKFFVANSIFEKNIFQNLHPDSEVIQKTSSALGIYSFLLPAIVVFVIIFIMFLFFNYIYTKKQLEFQQKNEKELLNYIQKIEALTTSVRQKQHDFTNMLLSLKSYIYADTIDQEGLKTFFEKICRVNEEEYRIFSEMSKIKNIRIPELKALIFSKMMQAQDANITFDLEVQDVVADAGIDILELIRVLGILLDNAIEAAADCRTPRVRMAVIVMEQELAFIVMNSTEDEEALHIITEHKPSSKGKNRGLGLTIIQNILMKYENRVMLLTEMKESMILQTFKISL